MALILVENFIIVAGTTSIVFCVLIDYEPGVSGLPSFVSIWL